MTEEKVDIRAKTVFCEKLIMHVVSPWFWIVPGAEGPIRDGDDPFYMNRPVPPPPPDLDKPIEVRWLLPTIVRELLAPIPAWTEWKAIPGPIEYGDIFEIGADPVIKLEENADPIYAGRSESTLAAQVRYTRKGI